MKKKVLHMFSALFLSVAFLTASASATTVTYDFSEGVFFPRFYQDGGTASKYDFGLDYDLSELTLSIDEVAGTVALSGFASGNVKERDGTVIGSATSSLSLTFSSVEFNPTTGAGDILALGVAGTSTSSGSFAFDISFNDGRREAETIDVYGGFASPSAEHATLGDLAGTSFNLLLRDNGQFDVWIKSSDAAPFTISHKDFRMHGDVHGTAAVPEPSSLLLLGTGAFGVLRKRLREGAR